MKNMNYIVCMLHNDTYFVKVACTMSAGSVYGKLRMDNSFIPRCLNIQLMMPLFVESIASWNIVMTVSGMFETNASYKTMAIVYFTMVCLRAR